MEITLSFYRLVEFDGDVWVVGSEVERKPIESKITVELATLLVPVAAAAPPYVATVAAP